MILRHLQFTTPLFTSVFLSINVYISNELYTNYNLLIYDNLQIGCKFTNDKETLHWSHTEPR